MSEKRPVQGEFEACYENVYDVIRAAVQVLGGAKVVGQKLWPAKSVGDAQRELLDATNRDRPRTLDPEELIKIFGWAREAGFHTAKHYFDDATGYNNSTPRDPADEAAQLQRAFISSVREQKLMVERMERLTRTPLEAVK